MTGWAGVRSSGMVVMETGTGSDKKWVAGEPGVTKMGRWGTGSKRGYSWGSGDVS